MSSDASTKLNIGDHTFNFSLVFTVIDYQNDDLWVTGPSSDAETHTGAIIKDLKDNCDVETFATRWLQTQDTD
jgi:hypothetical protein